MNLLQQEQFVKHAQQMVTAMDGDYMNLIKKWNSILWMK